MQFDKRCRLENCIRYFSKTKSSPAQKKKSEQCFTGKTKLARQYSAVCEHTEVKFIIFKHLFCFTSHKSKQSACDALDSSIMVWKTNHPVSLVHQKTREKYCTNFGRNSPRQDRVSESSMLIYRELRTFASLNFLFHACHIT